MAVITTGPGNDTHADALTIHRRTLRLLLAGMYQRGVNDGAAEGYGARHMEARLDEGMDAAQAAHDEEARA